MLPNPPLLTNVFPFSLVRRKMTAAPITMEEVKTTIAVSGFESAWGHENTIRLVSRVLGVDIEPKEPRPAVILDEDKFPTLYGVKHTQVILISPDFKPGFRPAIGEEVGAEAILGWSALLLNFN
jgi:hypothetical protein